MLVKESTAVARLTLLGGQDKNISSIFPHFPVVSLIFPQIIFSFFLIFMILVFRVGEPLPGKALGKPLEESGGKLSDWVS